MESWITDVKLFTLLFVLSIWAVLPNNVSAQKNKKPNILVIMGDDIGIPNISYLSFGMMGYKMPNIDRLAKEGMYFTDYTHRKFKLLIISPLFMKPICHIIIIMI